MSISTLMLWIDTEYSGWLSKVPLHSFWSDLGKHSCSSHFHCVSFTDTFRLLCCQITVCDSIQAHGPTSDSSVLFFHPHTASQMCDENWSIFSCRLLQNNRQIGPGWILAVHIWIFFFFNSNVKPVNFIDPEYQHKHWQLKKKISVRLHVCLCAYVREINSSVAGGASSTIPVSVWHCSMSYQQQDLLKSFGNSWRSNKLLTEQLTSSMTTITHRGGFGHLKPPTA